MGADEGNEGHPPEEVDLEAEGLLEGTEEGEPREGRIALLRELLEQGLSVEELRSAVQEHRLALLPAELALSGEQSYTLAEVAERTELDEDFLNSLALALGLPGPGSDERMLDEGTIKAAQTVKFFLDAGVSQDGVLEVTRVAGQGVSSLAQAISRHAADALMQPGDTELELGRRFAAAVSEGVPRAEPMLEFLLRAHLREQVRESVVTGTELERGQMEGTREVAIAFADLEGFTRLGERIPPDEIGRVANRLTEIASSVTEPPVRLVKTIGDAAMLACYDADALLDASLTLVRTAEEEEDEEFPRLSAGLAYGQALPRNGDWYGAPVNLASRITSVARPGAVVVTADIRERVGEAFDFSTLAPRKLKGVKGAVRLWRARLADQS
jgi:adenylate cyclase